MRAQNPQAARIIPIILKVLAFPITIRKKIKKLWIYNNMLYKHNILKIKRKLEKINKSENIQLGTIILYIGFSL